MVGQDDLEPLHVTVAAAVAVEHFGPLLQATHQIVGTGYCHAHLAIPPAGGSRAASPARQRKGPQVAASVVVVVVIVKVFANAAQGEPRERLELGQHCGLEL